MKECIKCLSVTAPLFKTAVIERKDKILIIAQKAKSPKTAAWLTREHSKNKLRQVKCVPEKINSVNGISVMFI